MRADATTRPAVILALGQARLQIRLLARNPLGFLLALVIPVSILLCLNLLTPDTVAAMPPGAHYAQFLTPAIACFCLLNTCYVNTVTGVVLAREEGVLKRLRGTPLPAWAYFAGRFGAVVVTSAAAAGVIIGLGVLMFDVTMVWGAFGYLLATMGLGVVTFFLLGLAVSVLVPKSDTALPVAYGTLLPLAFISDVFFSSVHAPAWLHDLASVFPVAPVARAMEACFEPATASWPMPAAGLLSLLAWNVAALVLIAAAFRWEPGPPRRAGHRAARRRTAPARPGGSSGGVDSVERQAE
jgi:ABC-2 type transport system permease protein